MSHRPTLSQACIALIWNPVAFGFAVRAPRVGVSRPIRFGLPEITVVLVLGFDDSKTRSTPYAAMRAVAQETDRRAWVGTSKGGLSKGRQT
jgi:hypothetical protein